MKELEETKTVEVETNKILLRDLNEQIRRMEKELKVAEVVMKEKDAECRLTELKIKELRK